MRPYITEADCIVLPSYEGEGTPKSLLEAAAIGRPIITTAVVGCRDVIENGVTGFLCQPRNSLDLAEQMERIISLSPEARAEMGRRGREKMEREFNEWIVIGRYLELITELTNSSQNAI